jgi:CBS domain-containing protein
LHTLAELELRPAANGGVRALRTTTLRDALSLLIAEHAEVLTVTDDDGRVLGSLTKDDLVR